ncbi:MAG: hypothetical protein ABMA02_18040 [Saprospiraceae bacterium]
MKRVLLTDLQDMTSLSWVLDQSLFLVANSDTPIRGSDLCRLVNLHPCELTRMKLAHSNPKYQKVVCRRLIFNLLRYLFQHFQGLAVWQKQNGQLVVRMSKLEKSKAECVEMEWLPKVVLPKRNPPKPGSTRWYLDNRLDN